MHKKVKLFSFKNMTTAMICVCWIVPIIIIFAGMSISYKNNMVKKTEDLMTEEIKTNAMTLSFHLNEVINLTDEIFYDRKLEKAWLKLKDGEMDMGSFYDTGKRVVAEKFDLDFRVETAFFYLVDEPDTIIPKRSSKMEFFSDENKDTFHEVTDLNNAKINIKVIDRQIYIVRNIYVINGYEKFATFVVALDMDKLIGDMSDSSLYDLLFYVDNNTSAVMHHEDIEDLDRKNEILEKLSLRYEIDQPKDMYILTTEKQDYMGFIYQSEEEHFRLCSVLIVNREELFSGMQTLISLILGLILVVIPVIAFFLFYMKRNVTMPVEALVLASREIKNGNMGAIVEIDTKTIANEEFTYLIQSFNEMSAQIKYLFDYAYQEEIARKDAQILALQSQINPHFLNNTLEMMNWQARMAGDIDVSKMIEALSTLLDQSMNRNKKKLSSLADELRCADAYFYILSMRFGKRLQVVKEIDEKILQTQVPQLILQPILENAVVHGIDMAKRGTIWLNVYERGRRIVLQVLNTGNNMTKEDEEKVLLILGGNAEIQKSKGERYSLGIRNVNQRIKLIYGEAYGLTIKPYSEGITAATIEIPKEEEE